MQRPPPAQHFALQNLQPAPARFPAARSYLQRPPAGTSAAQNRLQRASDSSPVLHFSPEKRAPHRPSDPRCATKPIPYHHRTSRLTRNPKPRPSRHLPSSHAQRLTALDQAARKWLATSDPVERLITAAHFAATDPSKPASSTEEIIAIARKEQYFPRLAPEPGEPPTEFDITQAFLDSLADQCEQARLQSGQAVDATSDLREETAEERAARLALLETIHAIQARARQKHYLANPHTLDDYGIGQRIDQNRATLLQWAATIYTKSGTDPLPKITTTIRQQLQTQRATYLNSHTQQTGAQGTASALRLTRDELLKAIIGGRQRIQFAADAEWPFTNPANHPIRMEFQLPASRPFVG